MQWIVKRDTYRTKAMADIKITGACKGASVTSPHPDHIQQGGIFELGAWPNEEEFQKTKASPEKILICELRVACCIGNAADPVIVARVEKEVAERTAREASQAARAKATFEANAALVRGLTAQFLRS